jgi:hypothetical protein
MLLKGSVARKKSRRVATVKVLVAICHGRFGANSYALCAVERENV